MSGKVTLYADANYSGDSASLGVGRYNQVPFGNDKLSSLRVPKGMKITLYEDGSYSGQKMVCAMDTPYVGDSVNDEISSFVIEESSSVGVIAYTDASYGGWSREFAPGKYDLGASIGNDKLSSLYIPDGYKVTLYEDTNYAGKQLVLLSNTPHLGDFNDRATMMVVEKMQATGDLTLDQVKAIIKEAAPKVYFRSDETFLPSSVDWFLSRATLKCSDGTSQPASKGLPAGGSDDHTYWLEIPSGDRPGNLAGAVTYVNVKKSTYWVDLQFWFFYPYNGAGRARVQITDGLTDSNLSTSNVDLDPMGQHGGDWEHCTLRYQVASKKLLAVYLAQHSGGVWLSPGELQYENGVPIVYASRHGHASYPSEGPNLTNTTTVNLTAVNVKFGLRNDTDKGQSLDCRSHFAVIGADFLTSFTPPAWLEYKRRWGPHKVYDRSWIESTISGLMGPVISKYTSWDDDATKKIMNVLPDEYKEEDGPTGPKSKGCWSGDE